MIIVALEKVSMLAMMLKLALQLSSIASVFWVITTVFRCSCLGFVNGC